SGFGYWERCGPCIGREVSQSNDLRCGALAVASDDLSGTTIDGQTHMTTMMDWGRLPQQPSRGTTREMKKKKPR
ncbi:MAG: hypothetical protein AAGG44_16385, partial [Planctomycetota bacterium]